MSTVATDSYILSCVESLRKEGADIPAGVKVVRAASGKPHISPPYFNISVSHSGEMIAVAFSDTPVGIDIERVRELDFAAISRRFFGYEVAERAEFFKEWTAREAYIKQRDIPFADGMRTRIGDAVYADVGEDYVCALLTDGAYRVFVGPWDTTI